MAPFWAARARLWRSLTRSPFCRPFRPLRRSKISVELLTDSVQKILDLASGKTVHVGDKDVKGKKRPFQETIELQVTLKNYDPAKDKRFAGSVQLPHGPVRNMRVCVLATADHAKEVADLADPRVVSQTVEDLKKLNKNKKLVKKLAKKYHAFLASHSIIKLIPRLLGPGLNRAGKFPAPVNPSDSIADKVIETRRTVKFQMKKVVCLNAPVANVSMSNEEVRTNIVVSVNLLVSMLKKKWQNVKTIYIKSTMGPPFQIYF
jgi:large subunit ribosomal protein L10Ae